MASSKRRKKVRDRIADMQTEERRRLYKHAARLRRAASEERPRAKHRPDYESWGDAERIVVNVATLYREFGAPGEPPNPVELFAMMGALARDRAGA